MPLSIDWPTKVITVPRADMTLIQAAPTEIRELDIDAFRLELRAIEDDVGMPYLHTHNHVAPISTGGVTLARVVELVNGYTVTFEDGLYAVNLVGANSNVGDSVNVNQVSVRSANSAGLIQAGSGLDAGQASTLQLILDLLQADEEFTPSLARKLRAGTTEVLLEKNVTGGNLTTSVELKE